MTSHDGVYGEMRPPRRRRHRPLTIDDDTATRLLDGSMRAADAPPGYGRVAEVLAAAAAPARDGELVGETAARAAYRTVHTGRCSDVPTAARRRRAVVALTASLAALLLLLGGLAAAVIGTFGGETGPSDRRDQPVLTDTTAPGAHGGSSTSTDNEDDGVSVAGKGAPDATGPEAVGLCRAYAAGVGDKAHAQAFRALAAAAAASPGADDDERIRAYCAGVIEAAGAPAAEPGPPDDSNAGGSGNRNANPGSNGNGNGNANPGSNGNGNGNANPGSNGNGNPGGNGGGGNG